MTPRLAPHLTRRQVLIGGGAAAAALLLGACGDDDPAETVGDTAGDGGTPTGDVQIAQFFGGPMFVAGQPARLPFGLADQNGLLPLNSTPERLVVDVLDADGNPVAEAVEVRRRSDGLHQAYFPLVVTLDEPGFYTVRTEVDGSRPEMAVQINATDEVTVVKPGDPMPSVATPTTADAAGVDPICTRQPECPLHEVSLPDALAEGRPIAFLVATPQFCQIAICGPVLDLLLDVADDHPGIRFLHAEVYADPFEDLTTYAPVIEPLGLHFEPCLFLIGPDGTVVDRVDTIYDRTELTERLSALA